MGFLLGVIIRLIVVGWFSRGCSCPCGLVVFAGCFCPYDRVWGVCVGVG